MSKVIQIRKYLLKKYQKGSGLVFKNNFELTVAVVLSAQCTDNLVNKVTPTLFRKVRSFAELKQLDLLELEDLIKKINYYKTKARNLKKIAEIVCLKHRQKIPLDFSQLIQLPGIGRKTANVILAENGIPVFPVDTHVARVAKRLGLVKLSASPEQIEDQLKRIFNRKYWIRLHHGMIWHGRSLCKARKPRCQECEMRKMCAWYLKN